MKFLPLGALGAALLLSLGAGSAEAVPVNTDAGFTDASVIDFSQYSGCGFSNAGCAPTIDVGGLVGETVTFTGSGGISGASAYNGGFGLGTNGGWNSGRNGYVGINNGTGFATFTFGEGVSDIGAFVNYAPGFGTPTIEILGFDGSVLELVNLALDAPVSTPGGSNDGAFRGFSRAANDIFAIRFSNSFMVVDDLTFARAVPVPASLPLLFGAIGILGLVSRRRKTA